MTEPLGASTGAPAPHPWVSDAPQPSAVQSRGRGDHLSLDRRRYPLTASYIAELPEGLASFPECRVNVRVHETIRADFPDLGREPGLPRPLADFFAGRRTKGDWFPEVVGNAIYLMIRDAAYTDDEQFLAWNQRNIDRLVRAPFYRALMVLLSTSFVVMGASKRWALFHRGTTMESEPIATAGDRLTFRAKLHFPPGLFTHLMLQQHRATFLAVLAASRAGEPEVRLDLVERDRAEYIASWQPSAPKWPGATATGT